MKRRIRKLIAVISSLCVMVSIMAPASATLSEEPQDNSLEAVLDRAEQNGFLYMYSDADQIFDGSRIRMMGGRAGIRIRSLREWSSARTPTTI